MAPNFQTTRQQEKTDQPHRHPCGGTSQSFCLVEEQTVFVYAVLDFSAWMSARAHMGKPIPKPTRHGESAEPVQLMQRLPRSLHAKLVARAKAEGTSLNTLHFHRILLREANRRAAF